MVTVVASVAAEAALCEWWLRIISLIPPAANDNKQTRKQNNKTSRKAAGGVLQSVSLLTSHFHAFFLHPAPTLPFLLSILIILFASLEILNPKYFCVNVSLWIFFEWFCLIGSWRIGDLSFDCSYIIHRTHWDEKNGRKKGRNKNEDVIDAIDDMGSKISKNIAKAIKKLSLQTTHQTSTHLTSTHQTSNM